MIPYNETAAQISFYVIFYSILLSLSAVVSWCVCRVYKVMHAHLKIFSECTDREAHIALAATLATSTWLVNLPIKLLLFVLTLI